MEIKVYDEEGKVVKTAKAEMIDLEFGTVRSIMEVLKLESVDNTADLLSTIYGAWEELTRLLSKCFPDMEHDDWNHVKLKELMPVMIGIMKYSFAEILTIPKDPKN